MDSLLQKNTWTEHERLEYALGGPEAYERAKAKATIDYLKDKISGCTDRIKVEDYRRQIVRWEAYLEQYGQ